jgi:hypothetical protein
MPYLSRPAGVAAAVLAASLAAALVVPSAAAAEPPDGVTLALVGAEGTGCPEKNSTTPGMSPDGGALSIGFGHLTAVGGETLDCRTRVAVRGVPQGYTYAVKQVNIVGGGTLTVGDPAELRYSISFADGDPGEAHVVTLDESQNSLSAMRSDPNGYEVVFQAVVPDEDLVWAPCDGTAPDLVFDTGLTVGGTELNSLGIESLEVATVDTLGPAGERGPRLVYRSC